MAAISIDGTPMTALPSDADQINYDNSNSRLSDTQVQDAIDTLANDSSTFVGTTTQWNNLTTAQKKAYKYRLLTDDYTDASIGNLSALHTTDKSSVVGAVNEVKDGLTKHAITFTANTGYTIEDKGSYVIGNVAYLNFFIKSSTLITSSRVHVGRMNIKVPVGNTIAVTCPSARVIDSTLNGFANVILGLSVSSSGSSIIVGDYVTQQDGCTQICVNCSIVIS